MSYSRPRLWSLLLTLFILAFLWLPPLSLYGMALWQVVTQQPARLLEAIPLQTLPRSLFLNTLGLGALTAVFTIVLGLPVAIALARGPQKWRGMGMMLCALPLALPPTLMATAFLEITRTPPVRSLASMAATRSLPIPSLVATALVLSLCYYPVLAFPVSAALRTIPEEIEEAAHLFETEWGVWRHVLWPLLSPAVLGATGIVCALSMWEMGAPDLLDARTYSVQIYRELSAPDNLDSQGKAVKAALAGFPMLFLGCMALAPAVRALRFYGARSPGFGIAATTTNRARSAFTSNEIEGNATVIFSLLVFAASPVAVLIIFITQLKPRRVLLDMWQTNEAEIANTIGLATVGTLSTLLLSFIAVVCWREWSSRWRSLILTLSAIPFLVAPVMLGLSLIHFWNRDQFAFINGSLEETGEPIIDWFIQMIGRYAMMLIGYMARFLPLALLLLYEAIQRIDYSLMEAASNLGASSLRATQTILVPLLRPALLGTGALVWALCAGELTILVLLDQPGGRTLPLPIFNQMHIGATAEVAALSLILAAMSGGVILLAAILLKFLTTDKH